MYHVWFALAQEKDNLIEVKSSCQKEFSRKISSYEMLGIPDEYKKSLSVAYQSEDVVVLNKLVLKSGKEIEQAVRDFRKLGWSVSSEVKPELDHQKNLP